MEAVLFLFWRWLKRLRFFGSDRLVLFGIRRLW
jgi:hypothetical protein